MSDDLEWAKIRGEEPSSRDTRKSGALRNALIFGSVAVALGVFATPFLDRGYQSDRYFGPIGDNIDPFTTASTPRSGGNGQSYVIRRSVLQKDPSAKCIIRQNGRSYGDC